MRTSPRRSKAPSGRIAQPIPNRPLPSSAARKPFGIERFRPNLVVHTEQAWVEDTWRTFAVGAAELESLMPWPRCAVPQIDQDTAERGREPAVALRAHRWCTEEIGRAHV